MASPRPGLCLWLALWLASAHTCLGHFNLFISQEEVRQLMGTSNELYYVRDGVVNTYALGFKVTVKAAIQNLTFSWQGLSKHPILYQFRLERGDKEAMDPPTLDIPVRGRVPDFPETFQVHLPCTGRKAAEVDVLIQLNVTSLNRKINDTVLNFMRKKICLFDDRPRRHPNEIGHQAAPGTVGAAGAAGAGDGWRPVLLEATEGLYATGGIAGALFVLSSFLMVLVWKRRDTSKMRPQECQYTSYASAYGSPPSVLVSKPPLPGSGRGPFIGAVGSDSDCGSYATIASFHKVGLGSALGLGSVLGSALGGSALGGSALGGSALGGSASRGLGASSLASGSLTKSALGLSLGQSLGRQGAASSRAASPYATSVVATGGSGGGTGPVVTRLYSPSPPTPPTPQTESAYSSYSSYCPRRVAYYAASSVNSFGKPAMTPMVDARLREPLNRVRLLAVPRHTLETTHLLYEGTFGQVYRGHWRARPGHHEDVIIKTVSDQASELQISVLLSEGLGLAGLSHEHILAPRAVSVEPGERPLLAYSVSIKYGNLKRFLIQNRTGGEGHFAILTKDMVHMAMQVALGVAFLHTHRIWHRDIATRNCIVDPDLRVKIADPGLSRDLFPNDYHCLGDSDNRPLGWLAPESLLLRHFSAASDVWAWGVLLWELVTLAGQPYQEVDPFEMADFLRDGYRLSQPASCPDELYGLMAACWVTAPEDRPSMTQLLAGLQEFSAALGHYI